MSLFRFAPSPGDALWPLTALFGGWLAATALLHACLAIAAAAARRGSSGSQSDAAAAAAARPFRAPLGPWLPSLSLFALGVAGGAALPLTALLWWLLLAAAALLAWALYGLPAAHARAARWAAEDEEQEQGRGQRGRRAAEADAEEGRRRR